MGKREVYGIYCVGEEICIVGRGVECGKLMNERTKEMTNE